MDARARAYESPKPEVIALVPRGVRRVLDLGCATGALAQALKQRGEVEVVGVERDPAYAAAAREHCDRVIEGDVEAIATHDLGRFDCLVAADVLEHLADPWSALDAYVRLLDPGCRAVISLPNIAHWTTYARLARGSWPRLPEGIHDATHLRWFTLRDAFELCEGAGLRVEHVTRRPWVLWRGTRLDRHAGPLARLPPFTFQHVLAARKSPFHDERSERGGRGSSRAPHESEGSTNVLSSGSSGDPAKCPRPPWARAKRWRGLRPRQWDREMGSNLPRP